MHTKWWWRFHRRPTKQVYRSKGRGRGKRVKIVLR